MTGWLLTWLWQGSALAIGVAVALRFVRVMNAATRHLVWFATLGGLVWLGLGGAPAYVMSGPMTVEPVFYIPSAPGPLISAIFGIWMSVALVGLVRVVPSVHALYALRDGSRAFPFEVESRLPLWLEAKACGRRTGLVICDALPGATVLGLQRPCIALPMSLVSALRPDELDQVILHEHAHVQRRDDWWRLAETLLVSVLWIHPAAFFISRALHREREMACDEWVVARTGLPKAYARCLARAAELRGRRHTRTVLAPALLEKRYELVQRVDRLLKLKGTVRRNASVIGVAAATIAIAASATQIRAVRFAEIAEVVLPSVARPIIAEYDEPVARLVPEMVLREVRPVPIHEKIRVPLTAGAISPAAPGSVAPLASLTPVAPSTAFAGVYAAPRGSVEAPPDAKGWSALGAPGVEIASAAKKTSVGMASFFSRAGVSLARSF